jgi:hypothetical protein
VGVEPAEEGVVEELSAGRFSESESEREWDEEELELAVG